MAAVTGGVIGIGGALYSANKQAGAAKAAGNKAAQAAAAAQQQLEQNYQRTQTNLQPYIGAGSDALSKLNAVNSGDYTGFEHSPDYQFSLSQGLQGLDRSAAARGSLNSGGQSADVLKFASGLASQNLGNYTNRLMGLAGMGQGAASNLGSIGTGNAVASGNFGMQGAGAQGQSLYDQANINTNLTNKIGGIAGGLAGAFGGSAANASSYGTPGAASSAGVLGGGTYNGPQSLATTWGAPNYFKTA